MPKIPLDHFDRGKPFYPIVMGYLVQLAGFMQLSVKGVLLSPEAKNLFEDQPIRLKPGVAAPELEQKLVSLNGPLDLRSEAADSHIKVPIELLAAEIVDHHNYLAGFLMQSACHVFVLAYDIGCKNQPWNDKGPLLEFLRHCRNAAAHNGCFVFHRDEPTRLATWQGFTITKDMDGSRLFKRNEENGLLSPGDPIRLLWDIEQAYPAMAAQTNAA